MGCPANHINREERQVTKWYSPKLDNCRGHRHISSIDLSLVYSNTSSTFFASLSLSPLSLSLSLPLSRALSFSLSLSLSLCLSHRHYIYLFIYLSIFLSTNQSIRQSNYPIFSPSLYRFLILSCAPNPDFVVTSVYR